MIEPQTVVCDAGPLIHLGELDSIDLMADFERLLIPSEVWLEARTILPALTTARLGRAQILDAPAVASARLSTLVSTLDLHAGEYAALRLLETQSHAVFLCDDAAARLAAESLGFVTHGTVGILVRAVRRGLRRREDVLSLLRNLRQRSSLFLSDSLLAEVVRRIEGEGIP